IRPPIVELEERGDATPAHAETPEGTATPPPVTPPPAPPPEAVPEPEHEPEEIPADLSQKEREKLEHKREKEAEKARKAAEKAEQEAYPQVKRWVHLTVPVVEGPRYTTGTITVSGNTV